MVFFFLFLIWLCKMRTALELHSATFNTTRQWAPRFKSNQVSFVVKQFKWKYLHTQIQSRTFRFTGKFPQSSYFNQEFSSLQHYCCKFNAFIVLLKKVGTVGKQEITFACTSHFLNPSQNNPVCTFRHPYLQSRTHAWSTSAWTSRPGDRVAPGGGSQSAATPRSPSPPAPDPSRHWQYPG